MPTMWMEGMNPAVVRSVGAPVAVPVLLRSLPLVDDMLVTMDRAHNELALQCAVASLGHYIPAMRRLPGFEELHKENYEVSYHLTTAIGASRRILSGSREPGYFALLVSCQREAEEHQRKAVAAFRRLAAAAPAELAPVVQRLGGHMQATSGRIQRAIGLSLAALGPAPVAALVRWTEGTRQD